MGSESNLIIGPHRIAATGLVELVSNSSSVYVRSGDTDAMSAGLQLESATTTMLTCGDSHVSLTKDGEITMLCGLNGTLTQCAGPPIIGPRIVLKPDSIEIAVGPPGAGASIVLKADGITLTSALTSLKLSALSGIEEAVGFLVKREAALTGHTLKAVESSVKVGPEGVTLDGPILKETGEAMVQVQAAIAKVNADAIKKEQAGIYMNG